MVFPTIIPIAVIALIWIFSLCSSSVSGFVAAPLESIRRRHFYPNNNDELVLQMVRNIDLPECLVFYGTPETMLRPETIESDLVSLLQECKDTNTAVVVIPDLEHCQEGTNCSPSYAHLPVDIYHHRPQAPPPNPLDLYQALNTITIQPRPFGGSAGFGAKQYADPERVPLAARTVVLCQTEDQTRAARYCGMRVLCLSDNDLADAIIDTVDFYLDDIATPGSFWLNPPNPRDEEGNKVEIQDLIDEFQQKATSVVSQDGTDDTTITTDEDSEDMSDDEMKRILADLSSL